MKILVCAYRDWALDATEDLSLNLDTSLTVIRSQKDFLAIDFSQSFDLCFFVGWSWVIPTEILENSTCICVHPSPLPKYRGGSPIQNQVIAGESKSAVTFFKMTDKLDAGPVILQSEYSLDGYLDDILKRVSGITKEGVREIISKYPNFNLIEQDETQATYFSRRTPEMSEITRDELQSASARQLFNKIRCLQDPYPKAFIECGDGTKLYLLKAETSE